MQPDTAVSAPPSAATILRMHQAEVLIPKARHFDQLAEERRWLGSFLARRGDWEPPRQWTARVEQVLACPCPELRNFLRVLEEHNRNRSRRANPFLLGPHLFHVIHSVEARKDSLQMMPALGVRRPAEFRAHFQAASVKAKALARVVQKAPQPHIALAARDDVREAFSLFSPCPTIQSPNEREAIVPLDRLLDEAAASLNFLAKNISRPSARGSDQSEAAGFLANTFRKALKKPYHSEVARIVQVLTGEVTDEDYVKKIEKRWAAAVRGQNP